MSFTKKAISTSKAALLIVVIVAVIAAGVYFASQTQIQQPTATETTTTTPAAVIPETLVIDDTSWPVRDLNALYEIQYLPWPYWLEHTVYQSLVVTDVVKQFGQGEIVFIPDLATSWSVSPDYTTYTFNLRQGIKFSSGNPFNSYQVWTVMYTWYYLNGNGTNFLGGLDLFDVSNVKFGPASYDLLKASGLANPTGEALTMMQDKSWPVYTTGPYQIVFHTKVPFLYLNGLMAGFQGLLFDTQWMMENGGPGTPAQFNSYFNDHPIPGTGPYMVTEVVLNSHVRFEKNPGYWGNALTADELTKNPILRPGAVATVIVRTVSDDLARYTDLSTDAAHLVAIKATNWPLVTRDPQYAWFAVESPASLTALALNTQIPPTNDVNVRQAIVHAINYQQVWERAYFGQATAMMGPETPNYGKYYNPGNVAPYEYNTDKAKEFLVKAGHPNGQGLPTLTLRTIERSVCSICINAAEIIQSNLADVGITVTINALSVSEYYSIYGNFQTNLGNAEQLGHMSFLGGQFWAPSALTPTDYWTSFVCSCSLWGNWAIYKSTVVDNAVSLLSKSADEQQILSALAGAQQQIANDAPYAWLGAVKLWYVDGSFVWKKSLIKEVWFDPAYTGINTAPLFNTIIFVGQS